MGRPWGALELAVALALAVAVAGWAPEPGWAGSSARQSPAAGGPGHLNAPRSHECLAYVVIDSRGSGERSGTLSPPGAAFVSVFASRHRSARVGVVGNPYPAVGIWKSVADFLALVRSGVRPSTRAVYDRSVAEGQRWLGGEIRSLIADCPSTKLLLTGYSQGAEVAANTYQRDLSAQERRHIFALVLFGDPYFNPADARADRGRYDRTDGGLLGTRPTFDGDPRVRSYCHRHDPVCQRPGLAAALLYGLAQHLNYRPDGTAAARRW